MSTRGTIVSLFLIAATLAFVIALAGCGGGGVSSADDAEAEVQEIVENQLLLQGIDEVTLTDVDCVGSGGGQYECVLQVREPDGSESPVGGTLTCDDDGCLFRGELRGG